MAKLRDYCQREEYYEDMEDYYKELKVKRLRKKEPVESGYIFSSLISQYSPIKALVKNVISKLLFQVIIKSYRTKQGAIMWTITNVKVAVNCPSQEEDQKGIPLPVLKHVNVVGNLEEIKICFARDVDTESEKIIKQKPLPQSLKLN